MSEEFKSIETQEKFDEAIRSRLQRERESVEKKFAGYLSPEDLAKKTGDFETKIAELNKTIEAGKTKEADLNTKISELEAKNKTYETASVKSRIAHETGLPYEAISFLQGEDEETIQKSANVLKGLMGNKSGSLPLASTETDNNSKDENANYKALLKSLRGEEE